MVAPQSTAKASPITSSMSPSLGAQQLPTPQQQQQQPSQLPTTIIQNTTTTYQHHQHLQKDQVPVGANAPSALTTSEVCNKSITNNNNNNSNNTTATSDLDHNQTNNPSRSQQSLTSVTTSSVSSQSIHHNTIISNNSNHNNNNNGSSNTLISTTHPVNSSITQQQFTLHGTSHHFLGSDHNGPAPNVTVNPHYQPNHADPNPRPIPMSSSLNSSSAVADQQIRVLTPSEIMRTLPSLCQEGYEQPPPTTLPLLVSASLVQSKVH